MGETVTKVKTARLVKSFKKAISQQEEIKLLPALLFGRGWLQ